MDGMYKSGQINQFVPNLQYLFKARIDLDVACLPVWQLYRDHQHDAVRECRRNDYPSVIGFDTLDYSRREPNSYALRREFFASFAKSHLARCVSCFDSL